LDCHPPDSFDGMADLLSLVVLVTSQGRTPSDQLEVAAILSE